MKTITIDVRPLTDTPGDFTQPWESGKNSAPRISFESPALLFKMLSGKRCSALYCGGISMLTSPLRDRWSLPPLLSRLFH
ncbi:MAG: hypothetical protein Q7U91_03210 [Sideroxyarcus sp.]|nr:hypothetical protein [Sideroxyarcus sp.]